MIVTTAQYLDWSSNYVERVGLNYTEGEAMVAAWEKDLQRDGVTLEELIMAGHQAAARLAETPPKSRDQHRAYLFGAIRQVRYERRQREQAKKYTKPQSAALPGEEIRRRLLQRGLLTNKYRREQGLPIHQPALADEERGDAWEPDPGQF